MTRKGLLCAIHLKKLARSFENRAESLDGLEAAEGPFGRDLYQREPQMSVMSDHMARVGVELAESGTRWGLWSQTRRVIELARKDVLQSAGDHDETLSQCDELKTTKQRQMLVESWHWK
jgi:hypothetical protein